jgi:hypothetical protein
MGRHADGDDEAQKRGRASAIILRRFGREGICLPAASPVVGKRDRVWCFRGSMLGTRLGREASMTKYTHCMEFLDCERYPIFIYTDEGEKGIRGN